MSRTRIIAGKAVIVIEAVDHVNSTLGKIRANLHRFSNTLQSAGGAMARTGFFGSIASGLLIRQFAKFDDLMLELRVKLGFLDNMTKGQTQTMNQLERAIRNLGKTTSFTSQEIAGAAVKLAQGGLNPEEIQNSLRPVLDLARGTRAALDDAGRMYVRTLRTFNIESKKGAEVVSQFVKATRFGTLNIEDLEQALRYSSGTAATLDQNLSPILALLVELSNKGLAGSIGGTSLNTAMANLVKKMEEIGDALPGFQAVFDQNGLNLLQTLKSLFAVTNQMSSMEQVKIFQDIFNLRGSRAIAGARDIDNIIKLADGIANAGNEAAKAAKIMDSGLGGRARIALSAVQDLFLQIGDAASVYLIPALEAIKNLINVINRAAKNNPGITALIALSPGILLASGAALFTLGKAVRVLASSMTVLHMVGKPVTKFLADLTSKQLAAAMIMTGIGGKKKGTAARKFSLPKYQSSGLMSSFGSYRQQNRQFAQRRKMMNASAALQSKGLAREVASTQRYAAARDRLNRVYMYSNKVIQQNIALIRRSETAIEGINKKVIKEAHHKRRLMDLEYQRRMAKRSQKMFPGSNITGIRRNIEADIAFEAASVGQLGDPKAQRSKVAKKQSAAMASLNNERRRKIGLRALETAQEKKYYAGQKNAIELSNKGLALAAKARKLPATRGSMKTTLGILGKNTGGSIVKFSMGLLKAANAVRKFAFSFTGILTIIEMLVMFTSVGDRLGKGIVDAFKAIGATVQLASGPFKLFVAGLKAISVGQVGKGLEALRGAFGSLVVIIGSQLVAAWNRFKAALGPVFDTVRAVGVSLMATFDVLFTAIKEGLGATFATVGQGLNMVGGNLFGGDGSIASVFKNIGRFLATGIPTLIAWIGKMIVSLNESIQVFLAGLERILTEVANRFSIDKVRQDTIDRQYEENVGLATGGANLARRKIDLQLEKQLANINKAFQGGATEQGIAGANKARGRSEAASMWASNQADALMNIIRRGTQEGMALASQSPQMQQAGRRAMIPTIQEAKKISMLAAAALVGSAQATRGNLLRVNDNIETQQLEALQDIRDDQRKQLRSEGVLLK